MNLKCLANYAWAEGVIILLLNLLGLDYIIASAVSLEGPFSHCEAIEGSACKGIGYNFTLFPNIFKHETQLQAMRELQNYYPLISTQCSSFLREFLCTLYIPPCTDQGFHLPPCRSLCLEVRKGCGKLQKFPDKFDCDNFPSSHELLCMSIHSNLKFYDPTEWPPEKGDQESHKEPQSPTEDSSLETELHDGGNGVQCTKDLECSVTGSVCTGGECVCEYPKSWGPLGCQLSQILGGSCTTHSECLIVTPNSVCQDNICSCKSPLTSYRNLSCIHGSEVGALCYNDAQCRAVNNYSFCRYLVAQVVGTCSCDPDQFVNAASRCVPRLGGRCEKGSCPKELGRATCKRNAAGEFRCQCQKRAEEKHGICALKPSRDVRRTKKKIYKRKIK